MKDHSLFLSKISKDVAKFVDCSSMIGALRVKVFHYKRVITLAKYLHVISRG